MFLILNPDTIINTDNISEAQVESREINVKDKSGETERRQDWYVVVRFVHGFNREIPAKDRATARKLLKSLHGLAEAPAEA